MRRALSNNTHGLLYLESELTWIEYESFIAELHPTGNLHSINILSEHPQRVQVKEKTHATLIMFSFCTVTAKLHLPEPKAT